MQVKDSKLQSINIHVYVSKQFIKNIKSPTRYCLSAKTVFEHTRVWILQFSMPGYGNYHNQRQNIRLLWESVYVIEIKIFHLIRYTKQSAANIIQELFAGARSKLQTPVWMVCAHLVGIMHNKTLLYFCRLLCLRNNEKRKQSYTCKHSNSCPSQFFFVLLVFLALKSIAAYSWNKASTIPPP